MVDKYRRTLSELKVEDVENSRALQIVDGDGAIVELTDSWAEVMRVFINLAYSYHKDGLSECFAKAGIVKYGVSASRKKYQLLVDGKEVQPLILGDSEYYVHIQCNKKEVYQAITRLAKYIKINLSEIKIDMKLEGKALRLTKINRSECRSTVITGEETYNIKLRSLQNVIDEYDKPVKVKGCLIRNELIQGNSYKKVLEQAVLRLATNRIVLDKIMGLNVEGKVKVVVTKKGVISVKVAKAEKEVQDAIVIKQLAIICAMLGMSLSDDIWIIERDSTKKEE